MTTKKHTRRHLGDDSWAVLEAMQRHPRGWWKGCTWWWDTPKATNAALGRLEGMGYVTTTPIGTIDSRGMPRITAHFRLTDHGRERLVLGQILKED